MNYFREIKHVPLRTFNQGVMAFNIREDEGEDVSRQYLSGLTQEEKVLVLNLYADVKARGAETVKREIMRSMPLQEDQADV